MKGKAHGKSVAGQFDGPASPSADLHWVLEVKNIGLSQVASWKVGTKLDAFQGKSHLEMDDLGVPPV